MVIVCPFITIDSVRRASEHLPLEAYFDSTPFLARTISLVDGEDSFLILQLPPLGVVRARNFAYFGDFMWFRGSTSEERVQIDLASFDNLAHFGSVVVHFISNSSISLLALIAFIYYLEGFSQAYWLSFMVEGSLIRNLHLRTFNLSKYLHLRKDFKRFAVAKLPDPYFKESVSSRVPNLLGFKIRVQVHKWAKIELMSRILFAILAD